MSPGWIVGKSQVAADIRRVQYYGMAWFCPPLILGDVMQFGFIVGAALRLAAASFLLAYSTTAWAADRVALVIGNGDYQQATKLSNPANDAADIAQALRGLGFDVVVGIDLTRRGLEEKVIEFSHKLDNANVALFFYAGHGLQVGGRNYLVPVDAKLQRAGDLGFETVDVSQVLAQMEAEKRVNLVFLDACRDNPLARSLSQALGTRSSAVGRGLASISSAVGTIIVYATQPDNVALDGEGRNSPFTAALLKHIGTPGLEISAVMKRVRADVMKTTRERQIPWDHSSLVGDVYLARLPAGAEPPLTASAPASAPPIATAPPTAPRLARADLASMFATFNAVLDQVRAQYIEVTDDRRLLAGAIAAMRKTAPAPQTVANSAGDTAGRSGDLPSDIDGFYSAALVVLNNRPTAVDDQRLVQSAIAGMLASLDPHSNYIDAPSFKALTMQSKGEFGGLGVEIMLENGDFRVVSPIDDSPAARAGIRANDLITHVDGNALEGLTLNEAVGRIRGPLGSRVSLTLLRQGHVGPIDLSAVREVIRVNPIRARMEGSDVGYIRLSQFNGQTTEMLRTQIAALSKDTGSKLKGFIIDVRNNPGGLLDQVVSVADNFLDRGEIVSTRGRKPDAAARFAAKPGDILKGKPLVVLVNGGTAAGAEILAAALQDNRRATIVGSRSFGKGTVQTIIPLGPDAGAIRLTTASYTTPAGRQIQARGIEPDIEALQTVPDEVAGKEAARGEAALPGHLPGTGPERAGWQSYVPPEPRDDKALQRALAVVRTGQR